MHAPEIVAATLLLIVVGTPLLHGREGWAVRDLGDAALRLAAGAATFVPVCFLLVWLGIRLSGFVIAAAAIACAALLAGVSGRSRISRGEKRPPGVDTVSRPAGRSLAIFARCAFAVAVADVAVKICITPLWSWDHFVVYGMKARRMMPGGTFYPGFENLREYAGLHPHYPLGLPLAWRILTLGATPGETDFKIVHLIFALALLAIVRQAARETGVWPPLADGLAGLVAISPLFWDTEAVGLADLPLALAWCAAFALLLRARRGAGAVSLAAGALIGFLPWIKFREGITAAILTSCAAIYLDRRGRRRGVGAMLGAAALSAATTLAVTAFVLPSGERFLEGDWRARAISRLAHPRAILMLLSSDLLHAEWFGFWLAFALVLVAAAVLRKKVALVVGAVVTAQMTCYGAAYFLTYLEPEEHIASSFYRIAAALLPLAAISAAAFFSPFSEEHEPVSL